MIQATLCLRICAACMLHAAAELDQKANRNPRGPAHGDLAESRRRGAAAWRSRAAQMFALIAAHRGQTVSPAVVGYLAAASLGADVVRPLSALLRRMAHPAAEAVARCANADVVGIATALLEGSR